jgi:endonuclease/exonuclease/phosphatase family metal-dependent hydrolase
MKIITLNTWGGRVKEPFIEFIKKYKDVDVFCFQEIYDKAEEIMSGEYPEDSMNIFTDIQNLLPEHIGFFRPSLLGVYGLAIFIKKDIVILEEGEKFIHVSNSEAITDGHHSRNMQWKKFNLDGKIYTIANVHGLWNGNGKADTPERIAQSNAIKEFLNMAENPKILCGDFNLNPDTESVKILEMGMKNLIKDYSVSTTRTSIYFNKPGKSEKFADYIFISPDIEIRDFKVLSEEVSDHAALLLEI